MGNDDFDGLEKFYDQPQVSVTSRLVLGTPQNAAKSPRSNPARTKCRIVKVESEMRDRIESRIVVRVP